MMVRNIILYFQQILKINLDYTHDFAVCMLPFLYYLSEEDAFWANINLILQKNLYMRWNLYNSEMSVLRAKFKHMLKTCLNVNIEYDISLHVSTHIYSYLGKLNWEHVMHLRDVTLLYDHKDIELVVLVAIISKSFPRKENELYDINFYDSFRIELEGAKIEEWLRLTFKLIDKHFLIDNVTGALVLRYK